MIKGAVTTVAEYMVGLGFDAAKYRVQGKLNAKKRCKELTSYIEHQHKYFKLCSLVEGKEYEDSSQTYYVTKG